MSIDATGIDTSLASDELVGSDTCISSLDTAARLKLVRNAFGFSQRELAKRAGVTNSSISMIEQGQVSPSIQSLTRILAAFPLSIADFFTFHSLSGASVYRTSAFQSACNNSGLNIQRFGRSNLQLDARIEILPAGGGTGFSLSNVDICGLVLDGAAQLTLISDRESLVAGDGFYIPAYQLYQLSNSTDLECRLFRCSLFVHKA